MIDTKSNQAESPVGDAQWLWQATVEESPLSTMIVGIDGSIEYGNRAAQHAFPAVGKRGGLASVFGDLAIADELVALVKSAISRQTKVGMQCVIAGKLMHVVIRPMPGADRRALLVMQLASLIADSELNGYPMSQSKGGVGPLATLTARELEVLRLIGHGLSTQQIADRLARSVKTIEWHRVSLGEKLGASNRVELARLAIRAGVSGLGNLPEPHN